MRKIALLFMILLFAGIQVPCAQNIQDLPNNLQMAFDFIKNGDFEMAVESANKQMEETPKSADAYAVRSIAYCGQGKYGMALSDINQAISYWRKETVTAQYTLYECRANVYRSMEKYEKAIADLDMVYKIALKADDKVRIHDALHRRAELYFSLDDYDRSDADYRLMLKHNEGDQVAMMGLMRGRMIRGDYKGAISLANECEKYGADYYEIYRFRMQAYDKIGEADRAIDDAVTYFGLAENPEEELMMPIMKKHPGYALALVNGRVNNDPDNVVRWKLLRTSLYEQGHDYAKAIADYNALEKEFGLPSVNCYHRSKCYAELGDFDRAITDLSRAIEGEYEDDYFVLAERADLYRKIGQYDKAIADCSQMIELRPTIVWAYYLRGWCYELGGDDDRAMGDYNVGIDIDKEYPYIFLMRGELHHKRGEKQLADADFQEVLRQDTVADTNSCRQYALFFMGQNAEAVAWMNRIIASHPDDNGVYYDQACLYARMGRVEEAIAALRTSLEKGFCSFAHIEHDDDLDAIRRHPDFMALIEKHKEKHTKALQKI